MTGGLPPKTPPNGVESVACSVAQLLSAPLFREKAIPHGDPLSSALDYDEFLALLPE
jgi:hypothetical protein